MKKIFTTGLVLSSLCLIGMLAGCSTTESTTVDTAATSTTDTTATESAGESLKVIATTFAEYDWTREILGDNIEAVSLSQLMDTGVDMHSFNPTVDDIIEISTCDVFIYTGGESSAWVADALAQAVNEDMIVINMVETLGDGAKFEEIIEGMEHDHDHDEEAEATEVTEEDHDHDHDEEAEVTEEDHDHDHDEEAEAAEVTEEDHDHDHDEEAEATEATEEDHDHDHDEEAEVTEEDHDHDHDEEETEVTEEHDHDHDEEETEVDEHVWLSLQNAQILCAAIADGLSTADPANADVYSANLTAYIAELQDLDAAYQTMIDTAAYDVLLFGDRFPFRYMVDDYGLSYYAAFPGCSAETEASFETITFLAGRVDALALPYVMTTETGHAIAQTVVDATTSHDQLILALDSMQSTTPEDGSTYLEIMQSNLEVLTIALNVKE